MMGVQKVSEGKITKARHQIVKQAEEKDKLVQNFCSVDEEIQISLNDWWSEEITRSLVVEMDTDMVVDSLYESLWAEGLRDVELRKLGWGTFLLVGQIRNWEDDYEWGYSLPIF